MKLTAPALFLGHGSPMNALQNNAFTESLAALGRELPKPDAIIVISAHWHTAETWVTAMPQPKTIHDFYGFPEELFAIQYAAPGAPKLAEQIVEQLKPISVLQDFENWGLDHGAWSMLLHMYPKANIPVVQLSIDASLSAAQQFAIGEKLRQFRTQNIMILASGNIVHNLRKIAWGKPTHAFDWAREFDQEVKEQILKREYSPLFNDVLQSPAARLSVPTPDHYSPLIYLLGASHDSDSVQFPYEGFELGSISLSSILFKQ